MQKWKNALSGRGLYLTLAAALCALGIAGALVNQSAKDAIEVTPASAQAPVTVEVVPKTELPKEKPQEITPEPVAEKKVEAPEELLPQVISPLDGTTVAVFSTSELMYDSTMNDWRTHAGIDIQGQEGDAVKTAAAGTVQSVTSDELMGNTVVIAHSGGYTTQYSSLMDAPLVSEGQQLSAGDVIGYVGTTAAAEVEIGPHIHFSVSKDGKVIDPADYVK